MSPEPAADAGCWTANYTKNYSSQETMKHILIRLLLSIGMISCTNLKPATNIVAPAPTTTHNTPQDDYEIYATILPEVFGASAVFVIEQNTFTKAGESKFKASYPEASGITLLSKIGYSSDRTQAFVTAEQDNGQDSGVINILLLHKESGQWKIEDTYELFWIV